MARPGKRNRSQGQLRIIGGQWRGRKLLFTPEEGLRPTSDRIRETLFNWLAPVIHDSRCADLFSGSGALGLEALSRGASFCDFVDAASGTADQIKSHLVKLEAASRSASHHMQATAFLHQVQHPYDIVFLDPPFGQGQVAPICSMLEDLSLLNRDAFIYIETAVSEPEPGVPAHWQLHREKVAGGVAYRLYHVETP